VGTLRLCSTARRQACRRRCCEARRGCGQALVEQWIDFTTTELDAPLLSWILPILGHWPYDKKVPPAPGEM